MDVDSTPLASAQATMDPLPPASAKPMEVEVPATNADDTKAVKSSEAHDPMNIDDSDEVVQECDIYLNRMYDPPEFVGDLYVLQYPLRPNYRDYGDQGDLDKVEFKQKARRLRFAYNLHQNDNYDDSGQSSGRHVLNSVVVTNPACSYAIGVIHRGRMTLVPIRAINQLRPDFEHVDRQAARQARGAATAPTGAEEGLAADDSDNSGAEENALVNADPIGAAPVRVEYIAKDPRNRGDAALDSAAADEEDPWVKLDYYKRMSTEAKDIYLKHIVWPAAEAAEAELDGELATHPKLQPLELDDDCEAFLGPMCGQSAPQKQVQRPQENDGLDSFMLSRLPADQQVHHIVRHLGIVTLQQLRNRLPPNTRRTHGLDETLIQLLKKCAVLVVGNWVVKSSLLGFEGIEEKGRDMLLAVIRTKKGFLSHAEVEKIRATFRIPGNTFIEMLNPIAVKKDQGWCLKLGINKGFEEKFTDLAKEFDMYWNKRREQIIREYHAENSEQNTTVSTMNNVMASAAARQRLKMLADAKTALANGGMTLAKLRTHLQERSKKAIIREEELQRALLESPNDVVQVRGLWMLGATGNPTHDKFRATLQALFKSKDVVSRAQIMEEYQRMHGDNVVLTEYVMRSLLREISERASGDTWVLKGATLRSDDA